MSGTASNREQRVLMKRSRALLLMNAAFTLASAAGAYAYTRYLNHVAYSQASGLCGSFALKARIRQLAPAEWPVRVALTVPELPDADYSRAMARPSPLVPVVETVDFTYSGYAHYTARCVVTSVDGLVTTTQVVQRP